MQSLKWRRRPMTLAQLALDVAALPAFAVLALLLAAGLAGYVLGSLLGWALDALTGREKW